MPKPAKHKPTKALVTGASSGIGREFARRLASMGVSVALVSDQPEALQETARELGAAYPHLRFPTLCKDLSEHDCADALLNFCKKEDFNVDILINNAGIFNFNAITDTAESRLNLYIDLHMRAVTMLTRAFALDMARRGCHGYILNMSSMSCWMPFPGIGAYSATKAYIRVLSRAMNCELRGAGVSVTVACPGGIATDLFGLSKKLQHFAVGIGVLATPEKFARRAVKKMLRRRRQYVNGLLNRISIVAVSLLPTAFSAWAGEKLLSRYATKH